ncbi:hypothetical protein Tdes44962_MAKER06424 [Teratosphaeria destructans]|uniref:Uncharacterized protein n=1 Tax=Teratosphaeria destructans TaxID=418781 RepID=A0A9W7T279_9PEZI|nr:hypothetical protein Tdes44962_MAKER06424 [Teratosphaeria destructans]
MSKPLDQRITLRRHKNSTRRFFKLRQAAERIYAGVEAQCSPDSEVEQEALRELRESLDQVRQWQDEDRPVRASGKQDVVEEHETGNADIQVEQGNTTMHVENPVEAEDTPDIYEPSKTTPSEKVDPHAKYGSLNHHPSLAIRDKLWHGLRSSSRKAQNVAFNAGSTLQKQPSISELRRSLQQREQMEDEA